MTWCDNGDLLAVWFSTNEEKGREMVVLSSRLRAGSSEWEKPRMFYQIADRNLTGTALLNDHQGLFIILMEWRRPDIGRI